MISPITDRNVVSFDCGVRYSHPSALDDGDFSSPRAERGARAPRAVEGWGVYWGKVPPSEIGLKVLAMLLGRHLTR
jgi:hypothetical protein